MQAVLSDDWARAEAPAALQATLVYLEALTRAPTAVGPADIDQALAAGVSPGALEQATLMVGLFAYMNRMVDAFGADVTPEQAEVIATRLDTIGGGSERLARPKPWQRQHGALPKRIVEQLALVRSGPGDAPAELRTAVEARVAAASGGQRPAAAPLPASVAALVDVMTADAHGVTDAHIDALKADDWSEEAIYEVVFTASFAACVGRMERSFTLLADR